MRLPEELLKRLQEHGWSVTRRRDGLDWWAREVWTVESRWSPAGLTLFLTFLSDSEPGNPSPFWIVGTSRTPPANRSEALGEPSLRVTPRWVEELPRFVAALDELCRSAGEATSETR